VKFEKNKNKLFIYNHIIFLYDCYLCTIDEYYNHKKTGHARLYPDIGVSSKTFQPSPIRTASIDEPPSKRKWIEMNTNGFVLFISNPDSDLLNPFLSPIKVSEFFKIRFYPYEGIKTKRFLFFSIKKKYADH